VQRGGSWSEPWWDLTPGGLAWPRRRPRASSPPRGAARPLRSSRLSQAFLRSWRPRRARGCSRNARGHRAGLTRRRAAARPAMAPLARFQARAGSSRSAFRGDRSRSGTPIPSTPLRCSTESKRGALGSRTPATRMGGRPRVTLLPWPRTVTTG
jgi:hypothetical protein